MNYFRDYTPLGHAVSKVAKIFLEKEFKKTFNKLLERILLAIN
jgi:hypothetical protein